jgi:hypothetical protein
MKIFFYKLSKKIKNEKKVIKKNFNFLINFNRFLQSKKQIKMGGQKMIRKRCKKTIKKEVSKRGPKNEVFLGAKRGGQN